MPIMIADGHTHVSPMGLGGEELGRRFKEAGGWFMALVSLPPNDYGLGIGKEDILKSFQIHLRECDRARDAGVEVACIAGMHPALIDRMLKRVGPSKTGKVLEVVREVMRVLEGMLKEGVIQGLGEFGRPHYKTLPESVVLNEVILSEALMLIRDYGGVIHLHLEQGGEATVLSVDTIAKSVGVEGKRVIFHHSSLDIASAASRLGYSSTVTGRAEVMLRAFERGVVEGLMLESDYIDDPRRPGVVMYPWEIGEELRKVVKDLSDEWVHKVMVDNVVKVYGVTPP